MGLLSNIPKSLEGHELRSLIIFSLFCQIVLVFLGDRGKKVPTIWRRAITWLTYLMADSVATYALGMITNIVNESDDEDVLDVLHVLDYPIENTKLKTFWAPFLLLHLGGPDRITAYSLEDNELWTRCLLSLLSQMAAIVVVISFAWGESRFSELSMLMMIPALIKYGERIWVLRAASSEHFENFIPDLQPDDGSRIMEEYKLKETEGYKVIQLTVNDVHEVIRTHVEADLESLEEQPSNEELYERSQFELLAARGLVDIFQRIFADLLLSVKDYATSRSILKGKNFLVVHKVIEIELGFLYDLLYTKALVTCSSFSLFLRFVSITITILVLNLFTRTLNGQDLSISMFDVILTYALLMEAISLEIDALYVLLLSDWTACWLINHKRFSFIRLINWFRPLHKRQRWSNSIGQYSLLSVSLKEKQSSAWHNKVLGFLRMDMIPLVEKHLYQSHEKVNDHLKKFIFEKLVQVDRRKDAELPSLWTSRGKFALKKNKQWVSLKWSIKLEFHESIIVWHIATEICYHFRNSNSGDNSDSRCTISKWLSRYMVYILVMYPSLLPRGTTPIKYRETYATGMQFFEQQRQEKHDEFNMTEALNQLLDQVRTNDKSTVAKGQRSKFLWHNGVRLAKKLRRINEERRWTAISEVWVEMLAYAASKCNAEGHARQLRRGGELLTHVWLLMTHFGLTDYFKLQNIPAIADMIAK